MTNEEKFLQWYKSYDPKGYAVAVRQTEIESLEGGDLGGIFDFATNAISAAKTAVNVLKSPISGVTAAAKQALSIIKSGGTPPKVQPISAPPQSVAQIQEVERLAQSRSNSAARDRMLMTALPIAGIGLLFFLLKKKR